MADQKTHYVGQIQHPGGRPENVEIVVNRRYPDQIIEAFTDADATPSVRTNDNNKVYTTANTGATTITDFDDGFIGQVIQVIIDDANTTIDFTASGLKGNDGFDWSPNSGDSMTCFYDGTDWYCTLRSGAVFAYGEMHINANSTATTVTSSDTWYQIVAGWSTGDVKNVTFSTDELVATSAGEYLVNVSFSMTGATNDTFSFALAKNDTADVGTLIERKTSGTDVGAAALNGMFTLAATDTITLWGKNQAATNDFTVTEATLTMVKVG